MKVPAGNSNQPMPSRTEAHQPVDREIPASVSKESLSSRQTAATAFEDNRPEAIAQRNIQKIVNDSHKERQTSLPQNLANSPISHPRKILDREQQISLSEREVCREARSDNTMEDVKMQNGNELLQRHAILSSVIQAKQINHDTPQHAEKNGRAGWVRVEKIYGETYGEAHNSPNINDVFGWQQLLNAGHTLGNSNSTHYNAVRMHLWNGRLDGPGNKKWNLAPGPAVVNSSMSAGPEAEAKYAVDMGNVIWLETIVDYQNNNNNANDFTNVVPSRMTMDWGYMLTANNLLATPNQVNSNGIHCGPAEPPGWEYEIDQPSGAMSENRKDEYRQLQDHQTVDLDTKLAQVSNQEKAQAFDLVTPELRLHIILNYPEVYESMSGTERANALIELQLDDALHLIANVLEIDNASSLISEIYHPLISNNEIQCLKNIFNQSYQIVEYDLQLVAGKWGLIEHVWSEVIDYLASHYRYFKYVPAGREIEILGALNVTEIDILLGTFPSGTERRKVLANWANSAGCNKASDWLAFIKENVNEELAEEFEAKISHQLKKEVDPGMSNRTRRSAKEKAQHKDMMKIESSSYVE